MTLVDRATRCVVDWAVAYERSEAITQVILDGSPPAQHYFSHAFPLYEALVYPTQHQSIAGKSQTYSVEGVNADLRHYLARLARAVPVVSRVRLMPCALPSNSSSTVTINASYISAASHATPLISSSSSLSELAHSPEVIFY